MFGRPPSAYSLITLPVVHGIVSLLSGPHSVVKVRAAEVTTRWWAIKIRPSRCGGDFLCLFQQSLNKSNKKENLPAQVGAFNSIQ